MSKKYDSKNYLPQEVNDEWFDTDFTQAKNKLNSDSLINTYWYFCKSHPFALPIRKIIPILRWILIIKI